MDEIEVRKKIVKWGRDISEKGLVNGTGGNLSVRIGDIILSTPTGVSLAELDCENLSISTLNEKHIGGPEPTKELPMHLAIYNSRPDVNAVVHTHSIYATTFSCTAELNSLIPVYIPSIIVKVGPVKVVPFELPGSVQLAKLVTKEIRDSKGLILGNHGVLTMGETIEKAIISAYEIEDNLKIHFLSDGKARVITENKIQQIFSIYGG